MFDPFKDFDSKGYLQNSAGTKDLNAIKVAEHHQFLAQLPDALAFMASLDEIKFEDFLKVHHILFQALYPTWAGRSRAEILPDMEIRKGDVVFCLPHDVQRAVEYGLRLAQQSDFRDRPGGAMGQFAWGHPFLDGNGRAMLLVHAELCHRAGFSVDWTRTNKNDYLDALTLELKEPGRHPLDQYLLPFVSQRIEREAWGDIVKAIQGLDGQQQNDDETSPYDAAALARYNQFVERRAATLPGGAEKNESACQVCGRSPCVCKDSAAGEIALGSGNGID